MIQKDTCIPVFITALLTIARTWKQPKDASTEERLRSLAHRHSGVSLRQKRERNDAICSNMDGPRHEHNKGTESDRDKHHDITYVWNPEYFG